MLQTSGGYLLLYKLGVVAEEKGLYEQVDSPHPNLRRDSAELFIKEVIPPLHLTLVSHLSLLVTEESISCRCHKLITLHHFFKFILSTKMTQKLFIE